MKKLKIKFIAMGMVVMLIATGCSAAKEEEAPKQSAEVTMKKEDTVEKEKSIEKETIVKLEEENMTNTGKLAPAFEYVDFEGNVYTNKDFEDQKAYFKYWTSWCSICLAGLSEVDELFGSAQGYTLYTVVTPGANGEKSKEEFIEWFNGLETKNIKVLFDMKGTTAKELGIRAFPTSVFIGSDGILIQALPGHMSNEEIEKTINSYY